jgi:AraC family transcriptional activator of pobA
MKIFPVLNINDFDFDGDTNQFYANKFSNHLHDFHKAITKPHKHDFYLSVLFTHGKGTHVIDFNTYEIKPGSLFFMLPGQTHDWILSDDIEGYIFFHTKSFYDLLFPNKRLDEYPTFYLRDNLKHIQLAEKEQVIFENYFECILNEYKQSNSLKYRKIGLLLDLIYIDSNRLKFENQFNVNKKNSKMLYYKDLQILIDENYVKLKKPKDYANRLNITVKHLNKIVNNLLNKSTSELINERIILEAKRLISHGNLSIKEIAYQLEYEDYSYFTRFFKNNTGYTPSEFSKQF